MNRRGFSVCVLLISILNEVTGITSIIGKYNETIEVPCNKDTVKTEDISMTKWKYTKADGSSGDLLTKSSSANATVHTDVEYLGRIRMTKDLGLEIIRSRLTDQKNYTCMLVTSMDIVEKSVQVIILKAPNAPIITNQAKALEIDKLRMVAECTAKDANPAANITWLKNNVPLVADGNVVKVTATVQADKETGLLSSSSKLEYTAVKGDVNAKFICAVQHKSLTSDLQSAPMTFDIHYPAEQISLQVLTEPIREGDNVTLKCKADGNPPPTSYKFQIKGKNVIVENSDNYTITGITRDGSGEYKCTLVDNEGMTGSTYIKVMYLDILDPNNVTKGKIVKRLSESFKSALLFNSSTQPQVSWSKNGVELPNEPKFDKLKFSDSGMYEYKVTMVGLVRKASFELMVQGAPVITRMGKRRGDNGKVLSCEAEGLPKPTVQWSINGTNATEGAVAEGKFVYTITIVPTTNLTVNCTVVNDLGSDTMSLYVSTIPEDVTMDKREETEESNEQTRVAVGVIVGLVLAAIVIGLVYWIYMKRTREGSWTTGEKENGTLEESKKLEETQSQKADV